MPVWYRMIPRTPQQSKHSPALSPWAPQAKFHSKEQCDQARTSALGDTRQTVEKYEMLLNSVRDSKLRLLNSARDSEQQEESARSALRYRVDWFRAYYESLLSLRCVADDYPGLYDK
jgi:hypothetical protein